MKNLREVLKARGRWPLQGKSVCTGCSPWRSGKQTGSEQVRMDEDLRTTLKAPISKNGIGKSPLFLKFIDDTLIKSLNN